jgi:hypothetical protein
VSCEIIYAFFLVFDQKCRQILLANWDGVGGWKKNVAVAGSWQAKKKRPCGRPFGMVLVHESLCVLPKSILLALTCMTHPVF